MQYIYCISLSCLLSFLCNPYIPFRIDEILIYFIAIPWHMAYIIGRAGASPPSRTNSMIFLYIYIYIFIYIFIYLYPFNRTSCPKSSTCFFFSDISIFLRRKCYTRFFFSGISIFRNLCIRTYIRYTYVCHAPCAMELFDVRHGFFGPEGRVLNKGRRDSLSADLRIEKEQGRVADRRLRRKGS